MSGADAEQVRLARRRIENVTAVGDLLTIDRHRSLRDLPPSLFVALRQPRLGQHFRQRHRLARGEALLGDVGGYLARAEDALELLLRFFRLSLGMEVFDDQLREMSL